LSEEPEILVCIPAFNEAGRIGDIIERAKKYATEVIVCDDGSVDNTSEIAKAAGATIIRHTRNKGYGAALKTLFIAARRKNADIMITLDSDGQHNPDEIPLFLEPILNNGFDMVIGSRFLNDNDRKKVPVYRSIGIKTITRTISYTNVSDAQSGFRAYSKNALLKIDPFEEGMPVSTEILLRAKEKNLTIKEIPITVNYDLENTSSHNPISQGVGVLFSVIQFISLRHPLTFYGLPGIALLVVSGVFLNITFQLLNTTKFVSINMILIAVGAAVIGMVLLATGTILYTTRAMLDGRIGGIFSVIQFTAINHPLTLYGLPGIALLVVSGVFLNITFKLFNTATEYTTLITSPILIAIGTAVIGIVLLATASIIYTTKAMLKGRIKDV